MKDFFTAKKHQYHHHHHQCQGLVTYEAALHFFLDTVLRQPKTFLTAWAFNICYHLKKFTSLKKMIST